MLSLGISQHIEVTPGICGEKPHIAGHRIKVQDIVIWHQRMGMSPDEIVYHHPSITFIFTFDDDFLRLASTNIEHCGMIYTRQQGQSIGRIISDLVLIWECLDAE